MIDARQLTKVYVKKPAVDDVSFTVGEGEIVGFLGPNGAGKTTTLRMLTGFLPPTKGSAFIGEHDIWSDGKEARRLLGYLPENVALYNEMRVVEFLKFRSQLEGVPGSEFKKNLDYVIERCLIEEVAGRPIGTLSKGFRQRVGLAGALIHRPKVLILDEPTVGLDPVQIIKIRNLIKELGKDHTILLSTHILPEVELVCSRVMIIDRGKILAQDTPENLRRHFTGNPVFTVTVKKPLPEGLAEGLNVIEGVKSVHSDAERESEKTFVLEGIEGADLRESIFALVVNKGGTLLGLAEASLSMEDIFLRLTTEETLQTNDEEEVIQ